MKVVTRTSEYTIYKKRNQRYAVRDRTKQWVRGDDKVAVLLAHGLVVAPLSAAPDQPETPESETVVEASADEASADEASADEASADADDAGDVAAQGEGAGDAGEKPA